MPVRDQNMVDSAKMTLKEQLPKMQSRNWESYLRHLAGFQRLETVLDQSLMSEVA